MRPGAVAVDVEMGGQASLEATSFDRGGWRGIRVGLA
jgi:hypothetical protein